MIAILVTCATALVAPPRAPMRRYGASIQNHERRNPAELVWRFSRPHTLIGTILAVPALHALCSPSAGAFVASSPAILWALAPAMLVNVFITGLNQLCDVDIDRVNKPHLPVASGDLSRREGAGICAACLVGAGAMAAMVGSPALWTVLIGSSLLGAAYSAPPVRLKRWPLLAALSIVGIRGALINVCFFEYAASCLETARTPADAHLGLVVAFFAIFGVGIALLKDVPDVAGDNKFGVNTLSTRFGRATVFRSAAALVAGLLAATSAAFAAAAAVADDAVLRATRCFASVALAALAFDTTARLRNVDPHDNEPVTAFYMHIWKLFYVSYVLLPLTR